MCCLHMSILRCYFKLRKPSRERASRYRGLKETVELGLLNQLIRYDVISRSQKQKKNYWINGDTEFKKDITKIVSFRLNKKQKISVKQCQDQWLKNQICKLPSAHYALKNMKVQSTVNHLEAFYQYKIDNTETLTQRIQVINQETQKLWNKKR